MATEIIKSYRISRLWMFLAVLLTPVCLGMAFFDLDEGMTPVSVNAEESAPLTPVQEESHTIAHHGGTLAARVQASNGRLNTLPRRGASACGNRDLTGYGEIGGTVIPERTMGHDAMPMVMLRTVLLRI